jgi:hypothetical protein
VHTVSEDNICTFKVEGDRRRYPHHAQHALLKGHTPPETNPKCVAKKVVTVPRKEAVPEAKRATTRSMKRCGQVEKLTAPRSLQASSAAFPKMAVYRSA